MNIFFGLCGQGSRFQQQGYDIPKYLIPYNGATMLYHAVDSLKIPGKIHFVVRVEHLQTYKFLENMLLALGDEIIPCYGPTEGAAQSLLLSKPFVKDISLPFLSVNCDQYLSWSSLAFQEELKSNPETSYIITYKEISPNCSYVRKNKGFVVEVREKKIISSDATIGVYHWAKTSDFFEDAEKMISDNHKENGEYYVAPVYNYSIARGLKVKNFEVSKKEFWPVGTVSDLRNFLKEDKSFL